MPSIYDIKPKFQCMLRPVVKKLASKGVAPNQVTIIACVLSFIVGGIVAIFIHHPIIFWIVPIFLFLRMAMNAIDGMLAKEHDMKTPLGALLNELTDILADVALYLPFALLSMVSGVWVVITVILAIISEATGLATLSIGASRRYDGPMGKSDRAFAFSLVAVLLALGLQSALWITLLWIIICVLLILTIVNRIKRGLAEIS